MKEFKDILFPIDFSECSESVFPYALDMAKTFDSTLHLLFVARDISYMTTVDVSKGLLMDTVAAIARGAEDHMQAFVDKNMDTSIKYETRVVIGNPADEILKYAGEQGIDMIVMGTHGRRGLDHVLMGSVADHVSKYASVPVLTVNPFRPKVKYVKT